MSSSSDVFIISAFSAADPAETLRQTIRESGVNPARVQDFIYGADDPASISADELARETAIHCPLVTVSSSLRALFFAAQSSASSTMFGVRISGRTFGASLGSAE